VGKSHVPNPPLSQEACKKEKECTLEITPSIEEPSLTITAHFEIDATYTRCNTTKKYYL
jgi:hypothetical protein